VVGLVALGQLRLSAFNQPEAALDLFDRYLAQEPSGKLSSAALSGRVRAFARMGQWENLIRASTRYLAAYPKGAAAAEMIRRRGDAHLALGDCDAAVKDFDLVIQKWPSASEANRARVGRGHCEHSP
jgi:TolA-binding protein